MSAFRKKKIVLSDYPYRRDIETRLLLATLTKTEIAFFNELCNSSLAVSFADLSDALDLKTDALREILEKFAPTKLYSIGDKEIFLDKEMRRYFEGELAKFEDAFEPGMEYLKKLLNKVPPHLLLNWYALPKSCDRIFPAIVDKYLAQPKIYRQYLCELEFSDPIPQKIMEAVFSSPCYKVTLKELQESLSIDLRLLHEWLLLLEFHLVLVLSYESMEDSFQEVVTPFHEWREYLLFLKETEAPPISEPSLIQRTHPRDFGFCEDLARLLAAIKIESLKIEELQALFPDRSPAYIQSLVEKALHMHFAELHSQSLLLHPLSEEWLARGMQERALSMTRHPIQVEKGLKRVLHSGWITVEDFLQGFLEVLRGKAPLQLVQQGKRWHYQIPVYNQEERALIEQTLLERLFEAGIVATGTYQGKACFCVTPFGLSLFE